MRNFLLLSAAVAVVASFQALAQNTEDEKYIGAGVRIRPAYEGADSSRGDVIPYLRLYGEHFFARTTQGILEGGWRTRPFGGWVFGAQLAYEESRISGESAFLEEHHFPDLDASASVGLHAEGDWKIGAMPLNALVRYRHDVKSDNGAQADVRVTAGILDWNRLRAGLYGQLTWADDRSTQRYFGVTAQQAATSGLPAYSAGSGLRYSRLGLLGDVDLSNTGSDCGAYICSASKAIRAIHRWFRTGQAGRPTPASPIASSTSGKPGKTQTERCHLR